MITWNMMLKKEFIKEHNLPFDGFVLERENPCETLSEIYMFLRDKYFPNEMIYDLILECYCIESKKKEDFKVEHYLDAFK